LNESEDYTPSLVAGLVRFRTRVVATVVAFAVLGAIYALVSWQPQATLSVAVQVSSGVSNQNIDADRATSEVAAQLGSPQVVDAAEEAAGVTIDSVVATWSQGQSTVGVVVTAGSDSAAEAGANALIPAYQQIRSEQNSALLQVQLDAIDASIADIDNSINLTQSQLAAQPPNSAAAADLEAELDILNARRNQLRSDRDAAQVAASAQTVSVSLADGPDQGPGRVSLLLRYVPAAVVLALVLCLAAIAVVERRRPWLSDLDTARRLLGAPVIAVGQRDAAGNQVADDVAPVVAMSLLRAMGDADPGIALVLPRGPVSLGDSAMALADRMQPVLERAGASATILSITTTGRAFVIEGGQVGKEIPGLWNELGSREHFEKAIEGAKLGADVVVLVPVVDVEHEVLLDLVLLADASVVATSLGTDLAPLFALRRDYEALGRRPDGVVLDPDVPAPVA